MRFSVVKTAIDNITTSNLQHHNQQFVDKHFTMWGFEICYHSHEKKCHNSKHAVSEEDLVCLCAQNTPQKCISKPFYVTGVCVCVRARLVCVRATGVCVCARAHATGVCVFWGFCPLNISWCRLSVYVFKWDSVARRNKTNLLLSGSWLRIVCCKRV